MHSAISVFILQIKRQLQILTADVIKKKKTEVNANVIIASWHEENQFLLWPFVTKSNYKVLRGLL